MTAQLPRNAVEAIDDFDPFTATDAEVEEYRSCMPWPPTDQDELSQLDAHSDQQEMEYLRRVHGCGQEYIWE